MTIKHVRQTIGHNLIEALHQCNLADVEDGITNVYAANDLNPKVSRQHEAYGNISDALTSLGFNRAREVYASEGDIDLAHAEIEAQYKGVAA